MTIINIRIQEYVNMLRERRIYTPKQTPFLQYICIYIDDRKVYKVLLHAYHCTLKKVKKVGIYNLFTFLEKDKLPNYYMINSPKEFDISKGRFIIQYSFKTRELKIYPGEPTEEESKQMLINYFNKRVQR
jgi:hypothetical protein